MKWAIQNVNIHQRAGHVRINATQIIKQNSEAPFYGWNVTRHTTDSKGEKSRNEIRLT